MPCFKVCQFISGFSNEACKRHLAEAAVADQAQEEADLAREAKSRRLLEIVLMADPSFDEDEMRRCAERCMFSDVEFEEFENKFEKFDSSDCDDHDESGILMDFDESIVMDTDDFGDDSESGMDFGTDFEDNCAEPRTPSPDRHGDEQSFDTPAKFRREMSNYRLKSLERRRRRLDARKEELNTTREYKAKRKARRRVTTTTPHLLPNEKGGSPMSSSGEETLSDLRFNL